MRRTIVHVRGDPDNIVNVVVLDEAQEIGDLQHPGEPASGRNDPAKPTAVSAWPDGPRAGRPRSATIAIRKRDGGMIGS